MRGSGAVSYTHLAVYKRQALGRVIGFVVMVLSIAIVAIPAGIFSAGFVEEFRAQRNGRTPITTDAEPHDGDDE